MSPFHDIPLFANTEKTVMNMVVEIPRWTNSKMEVLGLCPYLHCHVYLSWLFCTSNVLKSCILLWPFNSNFTWNGKRSTEKLLIVIWYCGLINICWIQIFKDYFFQLIHEFQCSLKCSILQHNVFIGPFLIFSKLWYFYIHENWNLQCQMLRKQQYVKWLITDFLTWSLQSRLNSDDVFMRMYWFLLCILLLFYF